MQEIKDYYNIKQYHIQLLEKWYKEILSSSYNLKASMKVITKWYEQEERYLPKWIELYQEIERFNALYVKTDMYELQLKDNGIQVHIREMISEIFNDKDKAMKWIEHSSKWTWIKSEIAFNIANVG